MRQLSALVPLALLVPVLPGCGRLEDAADHLNPVVVQGLYLGLDLPEVLQSMVHGDEKDGTFAYTATCKVFLAYLSTGGSENSPVNGAEVKFDSPASGRIELREEDGGKYTGDATDGLDYVPGETAELSVDVGDAKSEVDGRTPSAPSDIDLPESVPKGSRFQVHLPSGDYDNMIVALYNLNSGELTWENLPTDFEGLYEYTRPDEPVDTVTVPSEAVEKSGNYVVGVAGMVIGDVEGFEGVNTALSTFMAGRVAVRYLTVQ